MAVAFRAVSSSAAVALTSLSTSLPAGTVNGDGLLLVVRLDSAAAVTVNTPSGWTLIAQGAQATDGWRMAIFKRVSDGTAPTVTWDGTSHNAGYFMLAYSGTDGTDPVNVAGAQLLTDGFDTSSPAGASASITTTVNGCMIVALMLNVNAVATNALAGWTERIDNGYYASDQAQATAGSFGQPTFVSAASVRVNSILLALQPPVPHPTSLVAHGRTARNTLLRR